MSMDELFNVEACLTDCFPLVRRFFSARLVRASWIVCYHKDCVGS